MFGLEFSIIRRDIYGMTDAQRAELLDKIEKESQSSGRSGQPVARSKNSFPDWLIVMIKKVSPKAKYDRMNDVYKATFKDEETAEERDSDFAAMYNEAILNPKDDEQKDWFIKKHLQCNLFESSPDAEAADADLFEIIEDAH